MKKEDLLIILMYVGIILNVGCKSKEDISTLSEVSTSSAKNISGINVTLGGNITNNGNTFIIRRGVCWGLTNNPTINDDKMEDGNDQIGEFSFEIVDRLEPNKKYYVRAFCENSVGVSYGNVITFNTQQIINILNPMDILTTSVKFKGSIIQEAYSTKSVGFVYGKNPNPTINDNVVKTSITGSDSYEINTDNLSKSTIYYVRAYTSNPNGGYFYSDEKQFKTTGYNGPGGGYVAYDKGEVTNGWRYLEVYPVSLGYGGRNDSYWSYAGYFISGTVTDFGKGFENTQRIILHVSEGNCAAKLCFYFVLNGYADWFLPSSEEMTVICNSLYKMGINFPDCWTSTEKDADYAYSVAYSYSYDSYKPRADYKIYNLNVFPVRRY